MGKKFNLFRIKSVSDVITNSSTEVFLCRMDNEFKELQRKFPMRDIHIFATEDDVKKFVMELFRYDEMHGISDFVKDNILAYIHYDDLREECGKTDDEIWDFFKKPYLSLVGCAYCAEEDDTGYWDENFDEYAALAKKQGLYSGRLGDS